MTDLGNDQLGVHHRDELQHKIRVSLKKLGKHVLDQGFKGIGVRPWDGVPGLEKRVGGWVDGWMDECAVCSL